MVRILVDSSADYTLAELKEKNMEMVSLNVMLCDRTYADGADLKKDRFYEMLAETGEFPKTSQPSPQDFLGIFEDAREKGDDVICILLSSGLSGTYQSAVLAKDMAEYDRIYLIDSLMATGLIQVLADYACDLRNEGMDAEEIVKAVEQVRPRVHVVAALDTLEYLARGGRISKSLAAIGGLANLKPIITLDEEGKIGTLGKCLGRNKAVSYIEKYLKGVTIDHHFPVYSIYSYGTDNCVKMEEKLQKEGYDFNGRIQIGSTIGAHVGPGAFGAIYVSQS